jgi:2-keto-3-deoxy-L-rhamnonate aldolase RhmA
VPVAALALLTLGFAACGGGETGDESHPVPSSSEGPGAGNALLTLLQAGEPIFGVFSGEKTPEQGATMVRDTDADFILYSMETGSFDVAQMAAYLGGMRDEGGADALRDLPVILRVPPIEDVADTRARVSEALPTGIAGIVFPHVQRADQAMASVDLMANSWPADPNGETVDVLIVEDQEGIANAREIMATPGLTVVFAGPGDLRRAYEGDMEAVENAIQTVLAACKEFDVVCGVTAGVDDIADRLEQGFGMIIVTEPEAVAVGLEAAGRSE